MKNNMIDNVIKVRQYLQLHMTDFNHIVACDVYQPKML